MPKTLHINTVSQIFHERGYVLLSQEYKNCKIKLEYQCPRGHLGKISYQDFKVVEVVHCVGQ
jgi:hypothetical protein